MPDPRKPRKVVRRGQSAQSESGTRTRLRNRLVALVQSKSVAKAANEQAAEAQQEAIDYMVMLGIDKFAFEDPSGAQVGATLVSPSSVVIDYDSLSQEVGPKVWKTCTRVVPDHKLIEDAVARGDIPADVLARHVTEQPRAQYIKTTVRNPGSE